MFAYVVPFPSRVRRNSGAMMSAIDHGRNVVAAVVASTLLPYATAAASVGAIPEGRRATTTSTVVAPLLPESRQSRCRGGGPRRERRGRDPTPSRAPLRHVLAAGGVGGVRPLAASTGDRICRPTVATAPSRQGLMRQGGTPSLSPPAPPAAAADDDDDDSVAFSAPGRG